MNTPLLIFAIAAILITIFIVAVKKNARNAEEAWLEGKETTSGFEKGDFVLFCREFCDVNHDFFKGDAAWVTCVVNETTVEVSSNPDECVLKCEEPIKSSVISEDYLQQGTTSSGLAKGDLVELTKEFQGFPEGQQFWITQVLNNTTLRISNICSGCIDRKGIERVFLVVPETLLTFVNQERLDYLVEQ